MVKEFWVNLPVKDVKKSKEFFTKIGFTFNVGNGNTDVSAALSIGKKNVIVMLFEESVFRSFMNAELADVKKGTEVLFSIDAESRGEVDELAKKVVEAGGTINHKPGEKQGWMYGFVFADVDGHLWNVLHMDMSKMPK